MTVCPKRTYENVQADTPRRGSAPERQLRPLQPLVTRPPTPWCKPIAVFICVFDAQLGDRAVELDRRLVVVKSATGEPRSVPMSSACKQRPDRAIVGICLRFYGCRKPSAAGLAVGEGGKRGCPVDALVKKNPGTRPGRGMLRQILGNDKLSARLRLVAKCPGQISSGSALCRSRGLPRCWRRRRS